MHDPYNAFCRDRRVGGDLSRPAGSEIVQRHGAWIDAHNPHFGPGIAERFRWTHTIDPAEIERMRPRREEVARHVHELLGDDAVLCLPTVPGIAPKCATPPADWKSFALARLRSYALPDLLACRKCRCRSQASPAARSAFR